MGFGLYISKGPLETPEIEKRFSRSATTMRSKNASGSFPSGRPEKFNSPNEKENLEILKGEQLAYFSEHGMTPGEISLYHFWVDRLSHPDSKKADEAFSLFLQSAVLPIEQIPDSDEPDDVKLIKIMAARDFFGNRNIQETVGLDANFSFMNREATIKVLDACIGRLQREGQSQEAVLKVLNLFSMEVYEDRNAGWWVTKFHSSKLAAILSKKPREEWIILPE